MSAMRSGCTGSLQKVRLGFLMLAANAAFAVAVAATAAPVAKSFSITTRHDTRTSAQSQLEGDPATSLAIVANPAHGTASVDGFFLVYTTDQGYSGTDSFTYTASNDAGTSAPATVTVTVTPPTIALYPAVLSTGATGVPYSEYFAASGGAAPYTYQITAGALPDGLTLTGSILSGTPTTPGNFNFTVQATDRYGAQSSRAYGMPIAVAQTQTITFNNPGARNFDGPFTLSASATSGLALAFSSSTTSVCTVTPGGALSFITAGSCTIVADQAGDAAWSAAPTVSQTFAVYPVPPGAPVIGVATAGDTEATISFTPPETIGGASIIANGFTVMASPGGVTATGSGSPITVTGLVNGHSYTFTVTATNSAGQGIASAASNAVMPGSPQTIDFANPGTQNFGTAATLHATSDSGLSVTFTSATPGVCTITASGTLSFVTPGSCTINADQGGNGSFLAATTQSRTFTVAPSATPLQIDPTTPAGLTVGTAYQHSFAVIGGTAPYRFLIHSGQLPTGLGLSSEGVISGTPTATGTYHFEISTHDSLYASGTASYTVTVTSSPVAPSQSVSTAAGQAVDVDLTSTASGGPFVAAAVVSITPANAGSAAIARAGTGYQLRFIPAATAAGSVSIQYTLSNALVTSAPGVVTVNVIGRSDPSKDAEVQGLINAQANTSRRMASGQLGNFQQRLQALHRGNVDSFSNGFNLTSASLQRQRADRDAMQQWLQVKNANAAEPSALRASATEQASPALGSPSGPVAASPLAIWTAGTISVGDDARRSSDQDQDFVTSGLSLGADYRWSPQWTIGLGFGYGHDKTDIGDNGSRSEADSYSVAVYGSYRPWRDVYLDGVLGYQHLSFDNRRYLTGSGNRVTGERDGSQLFASLAAGYEHRQERWLINPYLRLDLAEARLDSYAESGDSVYALRYDEQTVETSSTSLGLRSEYALSTAIGELTPSVRLEYQHDFQGSGDASMRYADLAGGAQYHSKLDALGQNRSVLGLGLGLLATAQWSVRLEYQYTVGSGDQQAQSLLFNLEKPF